LYNKGDYVKLYEILNQNGQISSTNDIFQNIDIILDLAKDDVQAIAKSKNIFFHDFEYFYKLASENLKEQLNKKYLIGICKLKKEENVEKAIKWLVSRILNNMRNISTNPKYRNYQEIRLVYEFDEDTIMNDKDELELLLEREDLKRVDKNTLKSGLKKVWIDLKYEMDFDKFDFEELCNRYNVEPEDIIDREELKQEKFIYEQTNNGNKQLLLDF